MKRLLPRLPVRLAAVVFLVPLVVAAPSGAHPFGDPQQLEITPADSDSSTQFDVTWKAADDDLTSLALRLDVLGGPRATVFKDGAEVPSYVDEADAEKLAASPLLEAYLLSRIELSRGDEECQGELVDTDDLAASGARLTYSCASPTSDGVPLTVRAELLTDLHAAYSTMATGPGGATHVFTSDAPTHEFGLEEAGGPTAAESGFELLAWAGAGSVLLAGGAVAVQRRKRRMA
ncbi:hypothetical protein [Nocardioides gilvus]|uniref:hypothetical protein n=1 Tax=Nocardioides gilvus TaxID=1735589 RepID=UPI000D74AA18|nr:hypothetical protein [Nocardioides gilvus]